MCRAARGLLDWTQGQLAEEAAVSRGTVRDYEGCRHGVHQATAAQLRQALERGGARFIVLSDNDGLALCRRGLSEHAAVPPTAGASALDETHRDPPPLPPAED